MNMTDEIRELAENGDAEAQIFLGRQYENEGDNEQAFCWYKRAAMQCNADGQYHLAELYFSLKEYTDEEAYQRAAFWYTKAANQGHAKAMSKLGCLYTDGFYIEPDYRRAIKLFAEALKQGNDEAVETAEDGLRCAQYGMGNQYYSQKKYSDALQWYQMAAEHGHVISQFKLGSMYEKGEGVDTDYSKAEYWYTKAAENGNAEARKKVDENKMRNSDEN